MAIAKDFIFNLLADSSDAERTIDKFKGFAKTAAAGIAAAWGGAQLGEAMSGALDVGALNAKTTASLGLTSEQAASVGRVSGALFSQNFGEHVDINGAITSVMGAFETEVGAGGDAVLEKLSGKAAAFGQIFEVDVARGVQIASQMVSQGLAANGEQAFDLLTRGMQSVPQNLREDLMDALDEYGGWFTQMGLSGEEGMSMLVAASAKGMYGIDKTGDALKEFSIRATDMSSTTQGVYELLGLDAQEYTNMLLAGGDQASDAFNTIVLGLRRIEDPAARANAAIGLFGVPLEDLGVSDIPKFLESLQGVQGGLGDVSGALDTATAQMNDTPKARIEGMKKQFEGWLQSMVSLPGPMGDVAAGMVAFGPGASQAMMALTPLAVFTAGPLGKSLVDTTKKFGDLAVKGGASALSLGGKVLSGLGSVASFFGGAFASGLRIGGSALMVAGNAMRVAGVAFLTSPVTWIVLGIVAALALLAGAVYLIVTNWEGIVQWFGDLWTNIVAGVEAFIGWIGQVFLDWHPLGFIIKNWGAISDWFGGFWDGLVEAAGVAIGWILGRLGDIGGFFASIPETIGRGIEWLGSGLRNIVHGIVSAIAWLWNNSIGAISFEIPSWVPGIGGQRVDVPDMVVPALAAGGIVTGPTLALIGEAGPEAVVPLSQGGRYGLGAGGGDVVVEVPVKIDGRELWRIIKRAELREG